MIQLRPAIPKTNHQWPDGDKCWRISSENKFRFATKRFVVRELAHRLKIPLIDLSERTKTLFQTAGEVASEGFFVWLKPGEHVNYPAGLRDNTHFNEAGAREIAGLVVKEIRGLSLPLADYLSP